MAKAINPKTQALFDKLDLKISLLREFAEEKKNIPIDAEGNIYCLPTSLEAFRKWEDSALGVGKVSKDGLYHKIPGVTGKPEDTPKVKKIREELEGRGEFSSPGIFEKLKQLMDKTGDRKKSFQREIDDRKAAEKKIARLSAELVNLRDDYQRVRRDLKVANHILSQMKVNTNIKTTEMPLNIVGIHSEKN